MPNILGISLSHPGLDSMYFPVGHKENVNIDRETNEFMVYVLKTVKYRVMHHAAHDLTALPYLFELPFACTMIMGHMVDENQMSKSLDWLHKQFCKGSGKEMDPLMESIIKTHGWEMVPYALMYHYATVDARITMELFLTLKPLFEAQYGPLWSN